MPVATRSISPLIAKLQRQGPLTEAERQALGQANSSTQLHLPNERISSEGATAGGVHILLEGVTLRHKELPDGGRQIIGLGFPGDLLDLSAFLRGGLDYSTTAATRAVTAKIASPTLRQLTDLYPRLDRLLWTEMAHDMAIGQEWMVSLGRRSGPGRVAHFFCEFYSRLMLIDGAKGFSCALPLTQAELADALGLSCVHINRVLQQLRREGLIALKSGQLAIKDWKRLCAVGGFSPAYLSARQPAAANASQGSHSSVDRAKA